MNSPTTDARRHHDPDVRGFASDNYAGVHPEVLAALALANGGHQVAYGDDVYTENLQRIIRDHFGRDSGGISGIQRHRRERRRASGDYRRWGAVVCAESAHINVDEGGAPERMGGLKLLTVPTPDGKLTPELIDRQAWGWDDEHRAMPQVVSITQSTELGTLYTPDEIGAICEHARARGLRVHVDGSRIANAAASLDLSMSTPTSVVNVDIERSSEAAALAIRDPSTCTLMAPRVGVFADRADLIRRVQRAQFGALRDGDDLRHRPVFVGPSPGLRVDQLGGELAVGRGHGEQLEPAHPLGRAALVDVDVRALGAHHGTPSIGDRLQRDHIRTRTVEDRECLRGRAEVASDDALQVLGVCVVTVGDLVPAVGQRQRGKHLRVNARVIVTGKTANVRVVTAPGVGLGRGHDSCDRCRG